MDCPAAAGGKLNAARAMVRAIALAAFCSCALTFFPEARAESAAGEGQTASAPQPAKWKVGVHDKPPYAFPSSDGGWQGLAIDLWEKIARQQHWEYEYTELPFEMLVPSLAAGDIDIIVGELMVDAENERLIDFTQPFLESSLGVAVATRNWSPSWIHILLHAFDWTLVRIFLAFVPGLAVISLIIWWLERKREDGYFTGPPRHGIGSAFWFSAVTMTSTGYGDKVPVTFWGRVVSMFWMFFSLLLITAFTASVASTVAAVRVGALVRSPQDLRHYRNGVMTGSLAAQYLATFSAPVVEFETYEEALSELSEGGVDTVVGDEVSLTYLINQDYSGRINRLPLRLYFSRVAFGLPQNSPRMEDFNVTLLEVLRSPGWPATLEKYLGESNVVNKP
jgi:ABC-type amino acid transport substrate-binding protein